VTRTPVFLFCLAACVGRVAVVAAEAPAKGPSAPAISGKAPVEENSSALGQDEPLTLLVHMAEDCPVCQVWRESSYGLAVARQLPQTWPHLQVVFIERKSLNGSETESLYPTTLRYLYEGRKARYQLSPAVPLFEIVLRDTVIFRRSGLPGWSDGALPGLKALEEGREGSLPPVKQPTAPR
jgi:hypothetical protein